MAIIDDSLKIIYFPFDNLSPSDFTQDTVFPLVIVELSVGLAWIFVCFLN